MHVDIWIAIVIAAIGTYALRVGPLLWTQRHFNKHKANNTEARLPTWLSVLGPLMIAAMLGASLIPKAQSTASWIATAIGTVVTVLVWRKYKSLGLPVLCGVLSFGMAFGIARGIALV
ncbi:branched-chain amino acid ABC transporter [Alteromonas sp. V450]|uniref:AzlD domain-containing protein n=1 Tax=Alteromonas sp. V450 TaxID=1912139 RepID=UPI0008FF2078|nr:AzlD domain-containing protein [Alteromonas sp. V450]OJF69111.1 branched-chain amino acid ABC transporter [Alteromonas sp. V450]